MARDEKTVAEAQQPVVSLPVHSVPEPPAKKEPACPRCGGKLAAYAGHAAHKRGSHWCSACGERHWLEHKD